MFDFAPLIAPTGKYFIAICTEEIKKSGSIGFFEKIYAVTKGNPVHIVDRGDNDAYYHELRNNFGGFKNFHFHFLPKPYLFTDSIFYSAAESVIFLRDTYLATRLPYFMIIESGLYPPKALLPKFERAIAYLENIDPNWGGLGGLYHRIWRNETSNEPSKIQHVLSGYTVFKRSILDKYPIKVASQGENQDVVDTNSPDWIKSWGMKQHTFYDGHWIEGPEIKNPKTKPFIVRRFK